jgi:hypothetical protein
MTRFNLFKNWMAVFLVISSLTMCNKKDIENDPSPSQHQPMMSVEALAPCALTIKLTDNVVDGSTIPAGSRVCIQAGTRGPLMLRNFKGTATAPITFMNEGGKVVIKCTSSNSYGIKTEGCKYFKILGVGDPSIKYGIEVDGPHLGMTLDKLSSDYEISNTEVHNTGFAGIMGKTDPSCDPTTWRGNFVMRNVSLHNNYVHHVTGEGFYIGNSFYANGKSLSCGTILPHDVEYVKIFDNIVDNSGCEGIQVGCAIRGCEIYRNTVTNYGTSPFADYQNNGIQMGEGTGGKLYSNIVKNGPGNGLQILGYGDNQVFNNLVINAGSAGIFCDERYTPGPNFQFVNNTIINSGIEGIKLYSELIPMNTVINNVIIKPGNGIFVSKKSGVKITETNNYYSNDISSCKFVSSTDYHLISGSPLIDKGANTSSYGVTKDYDFNSRPAGAAYDIGAYEFGGTGGSITPSPTPTPTPSPTPTGQAVTSLTLVNADTDRDIATITNGYVINFATLGTTRINVRANTNPATVGSVKFAYDANTSFRVESGAPYSIAGDASGNYNAWTPTLGTHTIKATPYSGTGASGTVGTPLSVSVSVVNTTTSSGTTSPTPTPTGQAVTSITLVNADTDRDIATLTNGYVIDFAKLGTTRINFRANTNPATVGSVKFGYDANTSFRVESGAPYAFAGDASGNYNAWTPSLGTHSIKATPYSGTGASGTIGTAITITFTVVNNTTAGTITPAPALSLQFHDVQNANLEKSGKTIVSAQTGGPKRFKEKGYVRSKTYSV